MRRAGYRSLVGCALLSGFATWLFAVARPLTASPPSAHNPSGSATQSPLGLAEPSAPAPHKPPASAAPSGPGRTELRVQSIDPSAAATGNRSSESLPAPNAAAPPEELPPAGAGAAVVPLSLGEVLDSVDRYFPLLIAVAQERGIAAGQLLAAEGAFDLKIAAASVSEPMGFYKNYRNSIGIEQPTFLGGKVTGGYRIGDGNFEPWYGERQTNEGGEFALGTTVPFWRDRAFDKRRAELQKGTLKVQLAEPKIRKQQIEFQRAATNVYWNWIAAAQSEAIAREYLRIAQLRDEIIAKQVAETAIAPIERVDNRRLIASREAAVIAATRRLEKATIELSLFYRDPNTAAPLLVERRRVPAKFPTPIEPRREGLNDDIVLALSRHPELRRIRLEQQRTAVELRLAQNQFLPELDGSLYASKDVGARATPKNDKGPFELEAGLIFSTPLQRRMATGNMRTSEAELRQLRAEEQYIADQVTTKVQDAVSALVAAYQRIEFARQAVELAKQMEQAEDLRFELGQSNILFVNLREITTADAELAEIAAIADYFFALADYRAALAGQ